MGQLVDQQIVRRGEGAAIEDPGGHADPEHRQWNDDRERPVRGSRMQRQEDPREVDAVAVDPRRAGDLAGRELAELLQHRCSGCSDAGRRKPACLHGPRQLESEVVLLRNIRLHALRRRAELGGERLRDHLPHAVGFGVAVAAACEVGGHGRRRRGVQHAPGQGTDDAVGLQPLGCLESLHAGEGLRAEQSIDGKRVQLRVAGIQRRLQVLDRLTARPEAQCRFHGSPSWWRRWRRRAWRDE
jgi:hypothetical protein